MKILETLITLRIFGLFQTKSKDKKCNNQRFLGPFFFLVFFWTFNIFAVSEFLKKPVGPPALRPSLLESWAFSEQRRPLGTLGFSAFLTSLKIQRMFKSLKLVPFGPLCFPKFWTVVFST